MANISMNKRLNKELVAILCVVIFLEMHYQAKIHIIHISGERMKDQGPDGLLHGNLDVGVMAGKSMISFVPINRTSLERSPKLKEWLSTFVGD
jgi:hypothetical protein